MITTASLASSLSYDPQNIYDFPAVQQLLAPGYGTGAHEQDAVSVSIGDNAMARNTDSLKNITKKIKEIFTLGSSTSRGATQENGEDPIMRFYEDLYRKNPASSAGQKTVSSYSGISAEQFKQKYGVDANSITPPEALRRAKIGHQVYSNFRKGARTRSGHQSYHALGEAWDIGPQGGRTAENFNKMRRQILNSEFMRDWLSASKYGILDETFEEFRNITGATGPHFHFGPDRNAKRNIQHWFRTGGGSSVVMTKGQLKTFSWNNTWRREPKK